MASIQNPTAEGSRVSWNSLVCASTETLTLAVYRAQRLIGSYGIGSELAVMLASLAWGGARRWTAVRTNADPVHAAALKAKAERIIFADAAPQRIGCPDSFACRSPICGTGFQPANAIALRVTVGPSMTSPGASAAMTPPVPIPSQSPATPDHRARDIARFRRHAPSRSSCPTGTAFRAALHCRTTYQNMPFTRHANRAADQPDQRISSFFR